MRLLRGLGALLVLAVGVVGVPVALVALGGNVWPDDTSWSSFRRALLRPDDGTILIALITLVGWIAWLVFAASVLAELVGVMSGRRVRLPLPGLAAPQRLVAGLLLAVLSLAGLGGSAQGIPPPVLPTADDVRAGQASRPLDDSSSQPGPAAPAVGHHALMGPVGTAPSLVHVVERGDDLWSLAEHYYGHGREWRQIAAANPHVLSGGPDRLQVGWRLAVPGAEQQAKQGEESTVRVRHGDSLSSIAERAYGDPSRWRDIFEANRAAIDDPDVIDVGASLRLPSLGSDRASDSESDRRAVDRAPGRDDERAESRASAKRLASAEHERPSSPTTAPSDPTQPSARAKPSHPPATAGPLSEPPVSAPTAVSTTTHDQPDTAEQDLAAPDVALGVATVGGLLAAGLVGGLLLRRRLQLQARPVGRRIAHPPVSAQAVETVLGRRQDPLTLNTLDLAIRAIAAHCLHTSTMLPPLALAKVGSELIELVMAEPALNAPVGFELDGRSWLLRKSDAPYLSTVPGIDVAVRPYPALVTLGADDAGDQVLVDLESMGLLALESGRPELPQAMLAAMAVELSFSPWADEMALTLVGGSVGLPEALGRHNVTQTDRVEDVLSRLEQRAAVQRAHLGHERLAQNRIQPDFADPWAPEIVLVGRQLTDQQRRRLDHLMTTEPRVAMAAVVAGPRAGTGFSLLLTDGTSAGYQHAPPPRPVGAVLHPMGLRVAPQLLERSASRAVVDLVAATGENVTTPAPWWDHGDGPPKRPPPDNVTFLGRRFGGWGDNSEELEGADVVTEEQNDVRAPDRDHPVLRLLGPVELLCVTGTSPPRAAKQCLEYCAWLLEHPATTARAMASALVIAEGTRRSNMSRLRTWLGSDADGQPYLPDAYTGRIVLHPSVSSDWQRLQILTAAGVNNTSTGGLRAALELVRGAPLADAAPSQWHWAEELRTDMISAIRDIGVEVTTRALADNDIDLARWAASRALVAAPGDELLMAARIRTEHQSGNRAETERLTLQLAAQARTLGLDLDPATVVLLQEVIEGRVRARMA